MYHSYVRVKPFYSLLFVNDFPSAPHVFFTLLHFSSIFQAFLNSSLGSKTSQKLLSSTRRCPPPPSRFFEESPPPPPPHLRPIFVSVVSVDQLVFERHHRNDDEATPKPTGSVDDDDDISSKIHLDHVFDAKHRLTASPAHSRRSDRSRSYFYELIRQARSVH